MLSSKYKWQMKSDFNSDKLKSIASELNLYPSIVKILFQRGYQNTKQIKQFLYPNPKNLHDPFFIHDMKKGIQRIQKAIENNEQITIYGDYDADGITSTSIMYESLNEIGANVNYYVPNRFKEGYGPNKLAFDKIIKNGTSLIITVDNGITGNKSIDLANRLGCDVIVTDHHELPEELPQAYAIIHARFPDSRYPFGDLSGAGIAFKVSTALLGEIPEDKLDLVAIGTIADLVSLTDENRIITKYGLKAIQNTTRPGLIELMKKAGLSLNHLNSESIGFGIAPRLNALGRIDDANVGVKLLTTLDSSKGQKLSNLTEKNNNERKTLVDNVLKQAIIQAQNDQNKNMNTLLIAGKNWHEGVLGIVASRLVDKFNKPSIVLNINDENHSVKGSGRSVEGFNLFQALKPYKNDMISFGGHSMAIGLTADESKLIDIKNGFEKTAINQGIQKIPLPTLLIDDVVSVNDLNFDFYNQLQLIGPFGTDNEFPILKIKPSYIDSINQIGKDKNHLRFQINNDQNTINAIAFGKGYLATELRTIPSGISIVGNLNLNTWKGKTNLQFMVNDINAQGIQIIDKRTHYLTKSMFDENSAYIFFHSDIFDQVKPYLNKNAKIILFNNLSVNNSFDKIIIVDCPDNINDFKYILDKLKFKKIILYLYEKNNIMSVGMPTRLQCAKLFKFIGSHHNIDLSNRLDILSNYLNIEQNLLIFMLKLFSELKFISINNGVMNSVKNPEKHDLSSASIYRLRQSQIKTEKQLLLKNTNNLIKFVSNKLLTD